MPAVYTVVGEVHATPFQRQAAKNVSSKNKGTPLNSLQDKAVHAHMHTYEISGGDVLGDNLPVGRDSADKANGKERSSLHG